MMIRQFKTIDFKCACCENILYPADGDKLTCSGGHEFFLIGGIPDFTLTDSPTPSIYDDPDYRKWREISSELLQETYRKGSWIEKIQDYGHSFLENISDRNDGWRLDLGCGFGRHFDFLEDKKTVIGFDLNLDSLKIASANNPGSIFIKGHMEKLPFSEGSFGIIYAIYSLEHVYNLDAVIKELKRLLKEGGQLLLGLPAEGGLLYNSMRKITTIPYFTKKYGINYEKVVKIEHCNTATKVLRALESEFKLEKIKYYPFAIRSVHTNLILAASFRNDG